MRVGIVAEYNPFHNGHLYQIKEIRRKFGNDVFIMALISGDFVQRGELSLLDKWEKTEIILKSGIDLVAELPLYYSIQNAEVFAGMATRMLELLGAEVQVFGAEEETASVLEKVVELQDSKEYNEKLTEYMKKGNSYGAAQRIVMSEYGYERIVRSNNILGLEYIRSMKKGKLKIRPYIIKREASQYSEEEVEEERKGMASATYIRKEFSEAIRMSENLNAVEEWKSDLGRYFYEKNEDIQKNLDRLLEIQRKDIEKNISGKIGKFVPYETLEVLRRKIRSYQHTGKSLINIKNEIYKLLKYKLLMDTKKEIIKIYDITEEIYARIYKAVKKSETYEEFFRKVKARNLSEKRIERIMLNILLGITRDIIDFQIDYIRVLGFNQKGQEYMRFLKEGHKASDGIIIESENIYARNTYTANSFKGTLNIPYNGSTDINILVNWKDIEMGIASRKVKIEKNGFLLKELILKEKERLNPLIASFSTASKE